MNSVTASLPSGAAEAVSSKLNAFHLLGDRSGLAEGQISFQQLRPALFANYHDLSTLRYDFPLILVNDPQGREWLSSLADTTDACLQKVAPPGCEGEEIRRQVLDLEQEIRNLLSRGVNGSLSSLWQEAGLELHLASGETTRAALSHNLAKAKAALDWNGDVIDCQADLPRRLFTHAWEQSLRVKSSRLRSRIDHLMHKLSDCLRIDYLHSNEARDAGYLERTVGTGNQGEFDFQAMARILKSVPVGEPLSETRSLRIRELIEVFKSQRFVTDGDDAYDFVFDNCRQALDAFQARLPEMVSLVKAISIAELEIDNGYDESRHDSFYRRFGQEQLAPEELALFPSYLVVQEQEMGSDEHYAMLDLLRRGLPFKVVTLAEDIVGKPSSVAGQLTFGTQGQQLAHMALGLNSVFVLQSAVSSLYQLREHVMQGLAGHLPALFSIYSPAKAKHPCYLAAAAATESRAFPCFVFDPAGGEELASRFHFIGNPSPGQDWPWHLFEYEDHERNLCVEETAFTLPDFIAGDSRFAGHFAWVEPANWSRHMLPAGTFLELDATSRKGKIPYVLLIDEDNVLHRAVCDVRLIEAAERCRDLWHHLQELDGIHSPHALKLLLAGTEMRAGEPQQLSAELPAEAAAADTSHEIETNGPQPLPAPPDAAGELAAEPGIDADTPWIETLRCTSCNECIGRNDRMFAYDENQRAYIANPDAGSYRELVEAAENCQMAIIHPGKPRNPDEPGLEELLVRAEPFNT